MRQFDTKANTITDRLRVPVERGTGPRRCTIDHTLARAIGSVGRCDTAVRVIREETNTKTKRTWKNRLSSADCE